MFTRNALLMLFLASACGDDGAAGPTCGAGTTLMAGMCVADPGATCGAGTTLTNGECVPDSTTTCGPGTTLSGGICVIDDTAPGAVTGLAAAANGANIDLSWTAGSSSTGTLVARLTSGAVDAPAQGHAYVVGDMLPGGAKVIAVGAGTTGSDATTVPGRYSYMAWSINASGRFGFGREVAASIALPAQTGAISVDIAATAATVTTQPANVALAVANVAFNTDTVTFDLTITNNTAGPVFHPRAIATAPSVGTFSAATGATDSSDPFYELTAGSLLPGQTATATLTVTGVGPTDTITASLQVVDVGMIIAGTSGVPGAGGGGGFTIDLPSLHNDYGDLTVISNGMFSPSGRYFYALSRWTTAVSRIDTSNGDVTQVHATPTGTNAAGTCMYVGADGFAYIAEQIGRHHGDEATTLAVSRFDLGSMTPVATKRITPVAMGQSVVCAYRGHRLAIAWGTQVFFFDTDTMAFTDVDAGTTDVDGVDLGGGQVRRLALSADGTIAYASDKTTAIFKVDAAFAVTLYHTAATSPNVLYVDANNLLWWGSGTGLRSFDGTTETPVPVFVGDVRTIVELGSSTATLIGNGALFTLGLTTGAVSRANDLPNADRVAHWAAWYK